MTLFYKLCCQCVCVYINYACVSMCRATGLSDKYCSEVERKARAYVL